MPKKTIITVGNFRKQYRRNLGFKSQDCMRDFFSAKNIVPVLDFDYIEKLNERLCKILDKMNSIVTSEIKIDDLDSFKKNYVTNPFKIIKEKEILYKLNNHGRRPEQFYFNWMRGYIVFNYFLKALGLIFETDLSNINPIGDDDLAKPKTFFKRTPKADAEITLNGGENLRVEIQSGFSGKNDIKRSKWKEAKRIFEKDHIHTLAIHFDLFNGQVAFIKLDRIEKNSVNWTNRAEFENKPVFPINQKDFIWKITESPVKYKEINLD